MSQPFDPAKFLEAFQRGDRPVYGAVGGEPSLPAIRAADALDAAEYINSQQEAEKRIITRACLACSGKGMVPQYKPFTKYEPVTDAIRCKHCLGRGELPARDYEPQSLFSVVEMAYGGGSAFGLRRNDGLGRWHPTRYRSQEEASSWHDWLVLEWCEGRETILVEGFRCTVYE